MSMRKEPPEEMRTVLAEAEAAVGVGPVLARLAERLGASARADAIFGVAVERDGVTVIPVGKAKWGLGGGGGSARRGAAGEGFGGGGGAIVEPVGYIELRDGEARFRPIRDEKALLALAAAAGALLLFGLGRLLRR